MPHANREEKDRLNREFGELRGQRGTFEEQWRAVAELASPRDNIFNKHHFHQGEADRKRQYDESAELALDKASKFFGSVTTPEDARWHGLRTSNKDLNEIQSVREHMELRTEILFKHRYAPKAGYSRAKHEGDRSLLSFGTGGWFNGAGTGSPENRTSLWYRAVHLSEVFLSENNFGGIDKLFRLRLRTGRQILAEYPGEVSKQMEDKFLARTEEQHEVIDVTAPNPDWSGDPNEINPAEFEFMTRHWLVNGDDSLYLRAGGFRKWPYSYGRDSRRPTEQYGRGTLMKVLPAIQMLNQMKRTQLRTWHQTSDPTLLVVDDSSINTNNMRPGRIVVGGLGPDGNPRVQPFNQGVNFEVSQEFMNQTRGVIHDALGLDLFLSEINDSGRERVTTDELARRDQERSRLMTPLAAIQETEQLQPQIEREIDILETFGLFPQMPPELEEAEGEFDIIFTNPLAVSRRSDEAIGSVQTVRTLMEAATIEPNLKLLVDWFEYGSTVAESNSSPASLLLSKDEYEEVLRLQAEQQQLEMMAQAAPGVGRGIKDLASAEEIATGA